MYDAHEKSDWRSVMLAQYNIFGTIAGLEVASLSIFATLLKVPLSDFSKVLFILTALVLLIEVPLILWLINEERKVAFNDENMIWFRTNEKHFRKFLIWLMGFGWLFILMLLVSVVW